jgi:hypothetical protein
MPFKFTVAFGEESSETIKGPLLSAAAGLENVVAFVTKFDLRRVVIIYFLTGFKIYFVNLCDLKWAKEKTL